MISTRQMAEAMGCPAAGAGDEAAFMGCLGKARSSISATLVHIAELVEPTHSPRESAAPSPYASLDEAARRRVGTDLEEELRDMLDDAAKRGVTDRSAEVLLLTADIVRWLRDAGELPGKGAIELLEVHVAVFNDARHEEERAMQRALLAVLLALVEAQAEAIAGGRWRHRRVNVEAVEDRERRIFGANLDRIRRSQGLTIGELAAQAELEVLTVVGLIFAAESAGSTETRLLARALDVEVGALFPDPAVGVPASDVAAIEDGPQKDEPGE